MAALRYLYGSALQGGADAFVAVNVPTGLSGISGIAYRLREILIEWGASQSGQGITTLNGAIYEAALTRKALAAMPIISEKSLIFKTKRSVVLTTSGVAYAETITRWTYTEDDNVLLVEDPLSFCIDTAATTVANLATLRLGVEQVKISEVDRLTLITNSLS